MIRKLNWIYSHNLLSLLLICSLSFSVLVSCGRYSQARKNQTIVGNVLQDPGRKECNPTGKSLLGQIDLVIKPETIRQPLVPQLANYDFFVTFVDSSALNITDRIDINLVYPQDQSSRTLAQRINPFEGTIYLGKLTLYDLEKFRMIVVSKYFPGKTFRKVPEDWAVVCEMPLPADGLIPSNTNTIFNP